MADVDDLLPPATLDDLWDFDDPAGSESRFRRLLERLVPTRVAAAEAATQLARALGLQGRFAEAEAVLDGIDLQHPVVRTRIYLERGRLVNSANDPAGAIPHFMAAVGAAREAGNDGLEVDALHMLAIADPPRATEWSRQGLTIAEGSADPRTRRWAGALHNNLGWANHDQGRHDEALAEFAAALTAYQRTGTPMQVHVAHWAIARCLRSLGRYREALEIQERLARQDPPDAFVAEELGLLREAIAMQSNGNGSDAGTFSAR